MIFSISLNVCAWHNHCHFWVGRCFYLKRSIDLSAKSLSPWTADRLSLRATADLTLIPTLVYGAAHPGEVLAEKKRAKPLSSKREQTTVRAAEIVPVYPESIDIQRTLRGLMIIMGIDRHEIERRLKERKDRIEQADGPIH
jgi:hypothetical protein